MPAAGLVSIRSPHRSKGRPIMPSTNFDCCRVSIRSPHRSKGRHMTPQLVERRIMFQSAPLTEARGDLPMPGHPVVLGIVSIRSPHRSKGRQRAQTAELLYARVSIRSPHRSKGRQVFPSLVTAKTLFQSAPLTEARGDQVMRSPQTSLLSFNPLPSPKQGETLVAVTSGIPKGYTSGCANLLSQASYYQSESMFLAVTYC